MLFTIAVGVYCLCGGLLGGALITDKHCNTNKKEAFFCLIAGVLWPLAVATAASFGLYENIREKIYTKRQLHHEKVLRFASKLVALRLIGQDTYRAVSKRMVR